MLLKPPSAVRPKRTFAPRCLLATNSCYESIRLIRRHLNGNESMLGIADLKKVLLLAAAISIANASHVLAASEAAKKAAEKARNTPGAKAGAAFLDCLLIEVDKAKQINLSEAEFGKILASACPDEAQKARQTGIETLRAANPNKQWSAEDDTAVDYGVSLMRMRAYQIFTGVAKVQKNAK